VPQKTGVLRLAGNSGKSGWSRPSDLEFFPDAFWPAINEMLSYWFQRWPNGNSRFLQNLIRSPMLAADCPIGTDKRRILLRRNRSSRRLGELIDFDSGEQLQGLASRFGGRPICEPARCGYFDSRDCKTRPSEHIMASGRVNRRHSPLFVYGRAEVYIGGRRGILSNTPTEAGIFDDQFRGRETRLIFSVKHVESIRALSRHDGRKCSIGI